MESVHQADQLSIPTKDTHGTGDVFSAAITAEMAKGRSVERAVESAKKFVTMSIENSLRLGEGYGPVDPVADALKRADRYDILEQLKRAVSRIEHFDGFGKLIPESQTNLAMAMQEAKSVNDVAAIPGRIVRIGDGAKASSCPEFGASSHVARTILAAMKYNPEVRAAMNIRFMTELIDAARAKGFKISFYDRREEPEEVKSKEGMSTSWGAEQAIKKAGEVPDIIYHEGDWGKEPMIVILGRDADEVVDKALWLLRTLA